MADSRDAVLKKFERLRTKEGTTRRVDYKGLRARLNLRVGAGMSRDLRIIKITTGECKNSFCERILREAIRSKLEEIRTRHDETTWQAICDCAEAGRK